MTAPESTVDNQARCTTLEHEITHLAAHLHAATYRLLCLIREFDERSGWGGAGVCSCAHWLNWQCGIALSAAREKLRVAHALAALPQLSAAFAKGEVSYSKVRALTRVATPGNEDYLLMIARHGTATHVERLVRAYRGVARREEGERAARQHEARRLSHTTDEDGALVIHARLPAEQGAVVLKALQAAVEILREQEGVGEEASSPLQQSYPQNSALGDELSTKPSAEASARALEERPSIAQRRADALVLMAEMLFEGGAKPSTNAERYQVVVHVAAETLETRADGRCALDEGPSLAADTARRLACDASLVRMREDAHGQPLTIGRKTRAIPAALHRALRARDGGCRFPGCTHRHFIDAHHIRHWAAGGETRLDNLVQLCRTHHRLVHEGGFGLTVNDTGALCFRRPDGRGLGVTAPALGPAVAARLEEENHAQGLRIDAHSCVPKWEGETMDTAMAVEGLLARAGRLDNRPHPGDP